MAAAATKAALVVIGNFDGVHRGHQAVLHTVLEQAQRRQLQPRLFTFDPHPAATLGHAPPAQLSGLARKKELVARYCPGIEIVVQRFTPAFAQQTPAEFAQRILRDELHSAVVMVGRNFRFGRDRSGSIDDLQRLGRECGFEVLAEPLVEDVAGALSSTRVRALIAAGELAQAAGILGRPHMLSGRVQRGAQRGRQLGFPTCNVAAVAEALPPFGVYAVLVDRMTAAGPQRLAKGVANLGVRPSLASIEPQAEPEVLLEVHLFDVDEDLYGQELRVHLLTRQRDEQRFDGLEALKAQIQRDVVMAHASLAPHELQLGSAAWY